MAENVAREAIPTREEEIISCNAANMRRIVRRSSTRVRQFAEWPESQRREFVILLMTLLGVQERPERVLWSRERICRLDAVVNKAGTEAQVRLPAFGVDDFDRTGNVSVWRLQYLLTMARMYVYHNATPESKHPFLKYNALVKDKFTFIVSSTTEVARSFYQLPDLATRPSLIVRLHLGHIGSTSLNTVTKLIDEDTDRVLASNTNTVVTVDRTTRKPTPLPTWWVERYRKHVFEKRKLFVDAVKQRADDHVYTHPMIVSWDDVDHYSHTNFLSYVRFSLNAAMQAVVAGHFTELREDVLLYPVKHVAVSYKGESRAGEHLEVSCWQSRHDPFTVHFDISRQGRSIFQNTMQFYSPTPTQ